MNMTAFQQQLVFENKLFFRDKSNVFWNFIFPLIFLLLFGALNFGGSSSNMNYIDFLLPGVIFIAVFTSCVISTSISFALLREKGFYRRLQVTPAERWMLLTAQIVQRFFIVFVQTIFLIVVGFVVFSASLDFLQIKVLFLMILAILSFLPFGFLMANLSSNVEVIQVITMIPYFLMMFLGGAFWPVSVMPGFFRGIATILPATYFINGIRNIILIDASLFDLWKHIGVLLIWGVGSLVLSIKLFKWE